MGSGNGNRKGKDAPIIKRPIKFAGSIPGKPDKGGAIAEICLPSFDKKVDASNLTKKGVKVWLKQNGAVHDILIGANLIGRLGTKLSMMVTKCGELGVNYSGEIIIKNDEPYARFTRISR
jgi:hypothetical protein